MCKLYIGAVVPVYNHPRHLKRLVQHLREQNLPVILVDDGSTDECPALIAQLQHLHAGHVHVLRHPHNRGKGAAVRSGLLQAESLGWSMCCKSMPMANTTGQTCPALWSAHSNIQNTWS